MALDKLFLPGRRKLEKKLLEHIEKRGPGIQIEDIVSQEYPSLA